MARLIDKKTPLGLNIKLSTDTIQKLSEHDAMNTNKDKSSVPTVVKPQKISSRVLSNKEDLLDASKSNKSEEAYDQVQSALEGSVNITETIDNNANQKLAEATPSSLSSDEYSKHIHYEDDVAIYTDPQSSIPYVWCSSSDSWILKSDADKAVEPEQPKYGFENDKHTYTDTDGSKYIWDIKKNAWFPNVDDDFLAQYQMSYGFVDNTSKGKDVKDNNGEDKVLKDSLPAVKRKVPNTAEWFDIADDQNTKVYVSNLPSELTEEEFVDVMQKCGLVMRDPKTQKMKVRLYFDKESKLFKGDALCCYIKVESVELALNILDGSDVKGQTIKVERAQFQMKGTYDPSLKPKKKRKEKEKLKKIQEKLFDWRPEKIQGEPAKHERIVIVKNLFEPSLFDDEVHLLLEYQQDLREECTKLGEVRKVVLYDRHPEGVAQINMKEVEDASKVVSLLNGRWFGKRQLTAEIWDGRTKYRIAETDSEINKRIDGWEKFLEVDDKQLSTEKSSEVETIEPDKDK